jgi:hypothetical protein
MKEKMTTNANNNRLRFLILFHHSSPCSGLNSAGKFLIVTFLLVVLCSSLASCSFDDETWSEEETPMAAQKRRALEIESTHYCPLCSIGSNTSTISKLRAKNHTYLHKIMNCAEFNATAGLDDSQERLLRSRLAHSRAFKCTCTYFRPHDKCSTAATTAQYDSSEDELLTARNNAAYDADEEAYLNYLDEEEVLSANNKNPNSKKECLVAYMGMAVKGYNLAYKQWVSEEHCFNLCLSTTKRNGFHFDCRSFEHWQTDCATSTSLFHPNETFVPRICSQQQQQQQTQSPETSQQVDGTRTLLHHYRMHGQVANHRHHRHNGYEGEQETTILPATSWSSSARPSTLSRGSRAISKIEYCVLSNQSRGTAGDDFAENSAVTYYELLCKRKFNF